MNQINNIHEKNILELARVILIISVGWISAILSLIIYPFIFGFIGVVMGILASKDHSRAGLPVIVTSIILMGIGLMFSDPISQYTLQIYKHVR